MRFYLLLLALVSTYTLAAQDTIIFQTGDEISVKVLEIGVSEIKYKNWDNIEGPLYVKSKSEIFAIKYQNGTVEVMKDQTSKPIPNQSLNFNQNVSKLEGLSKEEKYMRGRMDAKKYYKGNGAMWATSAATFLFPPAGIVIGAGAALTPPKQYNFNAPDPQLLQDNQYHLGYKKQAQSKKAGKTLAGFGIGMGALLMFFIAFPPQ